MDSFEARFLALEKALREALAENALLRARVAELERQLGLTSSTSSKPPSSDGYKKPPRRTESLRDQTPKRPKLPKPRDRTHLEASETPDAIIVLPPLHECPCCQKDLTNVARSGVVKRQVFDMPEPKVHVTEFQGEVKVCSCGETVSNFPAHITAPVQYGPRLKSAAVYLSNQHFIPEDRLRQACQDMFGVALCGKTLANFNRQAAVALADDDQRRFEAVKASLVKHADETGMRIEGNSQIPQQPEKLMTRLGHLRAIWRVISFSGCRGISLKLQWLHTLSDGQTTHYRIAGRGDMPVGVTDTLVHDCWGELRLFERDAGV